MQSSVLDILERRGFVDAITNPQLHEVLKKPISFYMGFDPTADSLHLGHLMGIVAIKWLQLHGHKPFVLVGGATGKIGDPSGRSSERPLLTQEMLTHNVISIKDQLSRFIDFSSGASSAVLLNNDEWFSKISYTDFLRDVGKHFRIGAMLGKDSVRSRLQSDEGMSYTEFSYQLLQGYDFYYLHHHHGVCLQLGGSDQWGNITAGIDFSRKMCSGSLYGLTFPLLTKSDGKKFGKSEGGAVWLSSQLYSPYKFYQYLFRTADEDVINLLKKLTFIPIEEIEELELDLQNNRLPPHTAQKRLAAEVTKLVHGEEGLEKAFKVTAAALPGSEALLDVAVLEEIKSDLPFIKLQEDQILGKKLAEVFVVSGMLPSKSEAIRLIKNGGAYFNNKKVETPDQMVEKAEVIEGRFLLLSVGKKSRLLIELF